MPRPYPAAAAFLAVVLAGCASKVPQAAVAQPAQRRQVDAAADNRAVIGDVTPGIVMRLEIDGKNVQLHDVELIVVPRQPPARDAAGERVLVTGWRGQQRISVVSVADQRINVLEGVGIVIRDQRTLNVALPTPQRIDRVEVTLPGMTVPQQFAVGQVFDRACQQQPGGDLCR